MSAFNASVAANLKSAVTGAFPDFNIDLPNLKISQGSSLGPILQEMDEATELNISIAWGENGSRPIVVDLQFSSINIG